MSQVYGSDGALCVAQWHSRPVVPSPCVPTILPRTVAAFLQLLQAVRPFDVAVTFSDVALNFQPPCATLHDVITVEAAPGHVGEAACLA